MQDYSNNASGGVNYIRLVNWFWEHVPYMDGFKSHYGFLFFSIVDSVNKNNWQPVSIAYEIILYKSGLEKRMYLAGRQWLCDAGLIQFTPGKNPVRMAVFDITPAVQKCNAECTAACTTERTAEITAERTAQRTQLKTVNQKDKTVNNKQKAADAGKEIINPFSESFISTWQKWKDYKRGEFGFKFKTAETEQTTLNQLFKLSAGNEFAAAEIIDQSIANNWKGFFPLKQKITNGKGKSSGALELLDDLKSDLGIKRSGDYVTT